jgi:hypothetical protein
MDTFRNDRQTTGEAPLELTALFSRMKLPAELESRCISASRAAYAVDRMRRERELHQISELPFDRYIHGLAGLAGVSLVEVQRSFGLPNWDRVTASTVSFLARIARLIGLPVADAEIFLRWTYLSRVNQEQSESILAMPRGQHCRIPLGEILDQKEAHYDERQQAELNDILQAIRAEYTVEA